MSTRTQDHDGSSGTRMDELGKLPPTLKPVEAFRLLRVGRTAGYELIRKSEILTLRLGGKLIVPTAPLLRLIGVETHALDEGDGYGPASS